MEELYRTSRKGQKLKKECLRKEFKEKRRWLSVEYQEEASERIRRRIEALPVYKKAGTIFCYVSQAGEVGTRAVLEEALKRGKRVVVPRCKGRGIMEACQIKSFKELEPGRCGILEPAAFCPIVEPEEIEVCLVPCLAGSRRGERLGYGGGYYDRYLSGTKALRLLLCYEEMLCQELPREAQDCLMDRIITEKQVIFY